MGVDPEVNKIVSCGKKWKKFFHVLHKIDIGPCYTKQKINLAYPDESPLTQMTEVEG